MRTIISIFFVAVFCGFGFGQIPLPEPVKKCELTLSAAPVLRGLKLGMSEDEVVSFFEADKGFSFKEMATEGLSEANFVFTTPFPYYKTPRTFFEVFSVELQSYYKSVFVIRMRYKPEAVRFVDPHQFSKNVADNFNLPPKGWTYTETVGTLNCKSFEVKVDTQFNRISITNLLAAKLMEDNEERKRINFKP